MEAYSIFASVYDRMMEEIPYEDWCRFVTGLLGDYGVEGGLLLELGCGTGTLTELFAAKGFDMIGVDNSGDMLSEAIEKRAQSGSQILYLMQDMREFELYGTVAAIVSLCDSMNYLLTEEDLVTVMKLANNYLDPGGIFIFDLKSDHYFAGIGDRVFAEAEEEFSYIWQNYYEEDTHKNAYELSIFLRDEADGRYDRYDEVHEQRAFSVEEIKKAAKAAGMEFVAAIDREKREADRRTDRIYIILREQGKERA